jgi:hypothetical protein
LTKEEIARGEPDPNKPIKLHPGIERARGLRRIGPPKTSRVEFPVKIPKYFHTIKPSIFKPGVLQAREKENRFDRLKFFERNINFRVLQYLEVTTFTGIFYQMLLVLILAPL